MVRADANDLENLVRHLWGILNAVILGVNNSHAESMNSRIKTVKPRDRVSETNNDSAMRFTSTYVDWNLPH